MSELLPAAAVTYVGLPISSGGAHSLGRMSRRAAYQRTMSFLSSCTEPIGDVDSRFRINARIPGLPPPDPLLSRKIETRFGFGVIAPDRIGDALDFLDAIDPQPTNQHGMAAVWFWATTKFRILDPSTGMPIPGQDPKSFRGAEYDWKVPLGSSDLRLILHNTAALGLDLCIPNADEALLRRVVPWLQEHLPCRLSPKHWRAWARTRTGTFKARKLTLPV